MSVTIGRKTKVRFYLALVGIEIIWDRVLVTVIIREVAITVA